MGWNDHVEFLQTRCLQCEEVDDWEYWDEVGQARYVGRIGEIVGQDATKSGRCPHCGSTKGEIIDEDEDDWGEE